MKQINMDIVVVGGGAAGMAAAVEAKKLGNEKVVIIERAEELGGVLTQCIHNGFGLTYFGHDMTGPEYLYSFFTQVEELGIDVLTDSFVLSISKDRKVTVVSKTEGMFNIQAKAIILAMGCRERTRGNIMIPGMRPAGIITAGTAQRLVNIEGYIPGKRVVIIGSGDIGMIMARRLFLEGCSIEAVVEIMPFCSGLIRNENQCLKDFGIPLYLHHMTTQIHGRDRVEGVTIQPMDENNNAIPDIEKFIPCDTVLLAVGLIPENELTREVGIQLDRVTNGPVVNEMMMTEIPGIFAAGNVVQVYDLVDFVTLAGESAAAAATNYVKGDTSKFENKYRVKAGENVTALGPQWLTGENESQIRMRVTFPIKKSEIRLNGKKVKRVLGIRPSEMISLDLSKEQIHEYLGDEKALEVSIVDLPSK